MKRNVVQVVLATVVVLAFVSAAPANDRDRPEAVRVTNTSANPVPVTGTVTVGKTTEPVTAGAFPYTVPPGKRLVIEYFSFAAKLTSPAILTCRLEHTTAGQSARTYLPSVQINIPAFTIPALVSMGQTVKAYADPGTVVNWHCDWVGGGSLPSEVDFTGHFE